MSDVGTKVVIMPALGMAQDTGEIVAWHKQVGDSVKADDVLMEVETDKTTMEVEAGFVGYVAEIRAIAGTSVEVGAVVAVLTESADNVVAADATVAARSVAVIEPESVDDASGSGATDSRGVSTRAESASERKAVNKPAPASTPPRHVEKDRLLEARSGKSLVLASPKARLAAHEKGISLTRMMRSGVELPIQMADIDSIGLSSFRSVEPSTDRSQLQARVAADKFIEFANWLNEISEGEASATTSWCMFGAAAIRQAMHFTTDDDVLVRCENWVDRELDVMSINPDAAGLLDVMQVDSNDAPDLIIRDMTGTNIFNYQPSEQDGSVSLSIVEESASHYLFSLSFDEQRLELSQALVLLQCLGERTEQPLRHLL